MGDCDIIFRKNLLFESRLGWKIRASEGRVRCRICFVNAQIRTIAINLRVLSDALGMCLMQQDGAVFSVPSTKWRQAGHANTLHMGSTLLSRASNCFCETGFWCVRVPLRYSHRQCWSANKGAKAGNTTYKLQASPSLLLQKWLSCESNWKLLVRLMVRTEIIFEIMGAAAKSAYVLRLINHVRAVRPATSYS